MRHVIIGRGPAGVIAAETLRAHDRKSDVLLIGDEPEPAYSRMAIPYLLSRNIEEQGTWLRSNPAHFDRLNIEQLNARIQSLDNGAGMLTLDNGEHLAYDRLLIASGSSPVKPPVEGLNLPGVHHCWTLADARNIMQLANEDSRVVLMGAGFIGCIIMEALKARGVHLTVVEAGDRMVPRMMDQVAGNLIRQWCMRHGVEVHTSTRITGIERRGQQLELHCHPGEALQADLVVVATGVHPNIAFLQESGMRLGEGISVDAGQRTSITNIYAAGDVCEGLDWWGVRGVHAIQPMAVETGGVYSPGHHGKHRRLARAHPEPSASGKMETTVAGRSRSLHGSLGFYHRLNMSVAITLKLYASLMDYLPDQAQGHAVELVLPQGTTAVQVLEQHGVPLAEVHLVLVNGVFVAPSQRDRPLKDGDALAVWPAVAGG